MKTTKKAFVSIFTIFFSAIIISIMTSLYVLLSKQIEIIDLDSSSYQAIFAADSAMECLIYKEQISSSTDSVFLPQNSATLGDCLSPGDTSWVSQPVETAHPTYAPSRRVKSSLQMSFPTSASDFCATVNVDKENGITAYFTRAPDPDTMILSARATNCTEPATTRAIERLVEFYY